MDIDKYIKKEVLCAKIFIIMGIIGIAILLIDVILNFEIKSLIGVGSALIIGLTATGIGMLLIYRNSRKNPKMIRNI